MSEAKNNNSMFQLTNIYCMEGNEKQIKRQFRDPESPKLS